MSSMHIELLQVADSVSRERGVSKEVVINAIEQAVLVASRKKYGNDQNICAKLDRRTGEVKLYREYTVVEEINDHLNEITLDYAKNIDEKLEIGDVYSENLPSIDFGRTGAQAARQVIMQKIRDAERDRQYEQFISKKGEIVSGVVKRIEYGNITVDLSGAEAILTRDHIMRNEIFRQNDRIRAYVLDVRREQKGAQIFLSRTDDMFLAKLFMQEVPEIYDGIVDIRNVARDPGTRSKIAVYSKEGTIDAVGSCIGVRGSRIQAIINELQGEKIDVIKWSPDPATFVINALAPAEIKKVVIDEENNTLQVIIPSEQLSLAIGRRGQNVKLASKIVGWRIEALTQEESEKKRSNEITVTSKIFEEALDIDEIMAQLLAVEGFHSIDEIAFIEKDELANIEGFDLELAEALQERAAIFVDEQNKLKDQWEKMGVSSVFHEIRGMNGQSIIKLGNAGIKEIGDLKFITEQELGVLLEDSLIKDHLVDILKQEAAKPEKNIVADE